MGSSTLLEALRQVTQVDCDSLDVEVAKNLGPFVDCTSNQAIAFFELSRPVAGQALLHHDKLVREAMAQAGDGLKHLQGSVTFEEFVVDILMVKLQLLILPYVTGHVHVQTNTKLSYSKDQTVANAERIVAIFRALAPDAGSNRVCIKIPATWEGLQACRELEQRGITTLATTMFCMEQAALAADAKCTYIAPYVNELKVHFEQGYVDEKKAFDLCREAQAYYIQNKHRTVPMAASLTSAEEVMQLAGIQHITIAPGLLQELSTRNASALHGKIGEYFSKGPDNKSWHTRDYSSILKDENAWRIAFTRSGFGVSEGKIVQAINYFSDFQEKLEELVKQHAA